MPVPLKVLRVKVLPVTASRPKGGYGLDKAEPKSLEAAHEIASEWWANSETKAVLVTQGDNEDARYERPGFDAANAPKGWPARKQIKWKSAEVEQREKVKVPVLLTVPGRPGTQAAKPTVDSNVCMCCSGVRSPGQCYDAEDVDTTPSGRLGERRCMLCGRPLRMKHATIYAMWSDYQKTLDAMDQAKEKPWHKG